MFNSIYKLLLLLKKFAVAGSLATGNIREGDRFGSIRITSGHQYAAAVKDKCDLGLYLSVYSKRNEEELVHMALVFRKQ